MQGSKHQVFVQVDEDLLVPLTLEIASGKLGFLCNLPTGHPLEQEAIGFMEEFADELRGADCHFEESTRESGGEHRIEAVLIGL